MVSGITATSSGDYDGSHAIVRDRDRRIDRGGHRQRDERWETREVRDEEREAKRGKQMSVR